MKDRAEWHLDKRVNLTLIIMVVGQVAFGAWWASKMEQRVHAVENRMLEIMADIEKNRQTAMSERASIRVDAAQMNLRYTSMSQDIARLQGQLEQINRNIERLLDRLDKQDNKP